MILSLLAADAFVFKGGDIGDLGRALADWSGRPTIALVQGDAREHAYGIDLKAVGDGKDLVRLLRVKGHVQSSTADGTIDVWDAAWKEPTVDYDFGDPVPPEGMKAVKPNEDWLQNGRVTIRLRPGEIVRVADLETMPWSRPLDVHWFNRRMWIVPTVRSLPEREFLVAVARATGCSFVGADNESKLVFDAKAFRPRALATIEARTWTADTPLIGVLVQRLARKSWSEASDKLLTELFSKPNQSRGYIEVRDSATANLAQSYLAAQAAFVGAASDQPRPFAEAVADQLRLIDTSKPPHYSLSQSIGAFFMWPSKEGGSIML